MLVNHVLQRIKEHPEKPAVIAAGRSVDYRGLGQGIGRVVAQLESMGVTAGERVLLAASVSPAFVQAYLATHYLGAIAVPVDPKVSPATLAYVREQTSPKALFLARDAGDALPIDSLLDSSHPAAKLSPRVATANAPADLLFTSGTSGKPKGVLLSQGAIEAAANYINAFVGNGSDDREVLPLPLSHSFGLGRLRCNLLAGATLILEDGFMSPGTLLGAFRAQAATGFACVPSGFAVLFKMAGDRLGEFADSLRYIEIGSAPMPEEHKKQLMRLLPKTRICMHYGLTEASRSAFIEFHDSADRLDSIGKPSPGVTIRVANAGGDECAPGETGRLLVRSDAVMSRYWNDDEATAKAFVNGFLDTGDVGRRDKDGYLYLEARASDLINVGGRKVAPAEVETLLDEHPAVAASACVGIPDPQGLTGMAVKAFLVARDPADRPTNAQLAKHLRGRLESYKMPKAFEWVDALPRTESGKLQRSRLL